MLILSIVYNLFLSKYLFIRKNNNDNELLKREIICKNILVSIVLRS